VISRKRQGKYTKGRFFREKQGVNLDDLFDKPGYRYISLQNPLKAAKIAIIFKKKVGKPKSPGVRKKVNNLSVFLTSGLSGFRTGLTLHL
jgi:hypothetical protein